MINKKYLPSKRFVAALSIAVFIVLLTVVLNAIKPSAPKYDNNNLVALTATSSAMEIDSDHDGLPDWEEALYGTDPHNPDTDGDGTPDGEEIKEGRDPLKANTAGPGQPPNDYIDPSIVAESNAVSSADQGLNATEKMAHDLVSDIIASQPVSGSMDTDTVNNLVNQAVSDIPQKQFTGTTTVSDLNLIAVPSDNATLKSDLAVYGNNYYVLTDAFERIMGQDAAIIDDSMSNNKDLDATKMASIAAIYQYIANGLISLPLPAATNSAGAAYALEIINDMQGLAQIDNDIITASANADTASIYADLGTYNDTLTDITQALDTMDAMLGIKR